MPLIKKFKLEVKPSIKRGLAATVTCLIFGFSVASPKTVAAANNGVVVYGQGNCFIFKTNRGYTLFERSGGTGPKIDQTVRGTLHDFGYQQLFDSRGKEIVIGFVQDFGVKSASEVQAFKKTCR
jgi:hypothetical protein